LNLGDLICRKSAMLENKKIPKITNRYKITINNLNGFSFVLEDLSHPVSKNCEVGHWF
jgi:hypothetical protein